MTNPMAFNLDRLMTDEELAQAIRLINAAEARFRIYDLANNPLSTEELHARVFAWYERQAEARAAVRFVSETRTTFSNNNPSDAWIRRSHAQRGQSRRRRT